MKLDGGDPPRESAADVAFGERDAEDLEDEEKDDEEGLIIGKGTAPAGRGMDTASLDEG